jgi:hypothetical protein
LSKNLSELWDETRPGSNHSSLDFDPDGIVSLISELHSEFKNPPKRSVTVTAPDFRQGGKIQTIQKLVDEAATFPETAGAAEGAVPPLQPAAAKQQKAKHTKVKTVKATP